MATAAGDTSSHQTGQPFEDLGFSLLRPDLIGYAPAGNLTQNDAIKARQSRGESIVNLGFGQSPFPIPQRAVAELRAHAADGAYLPACGTQELRRAIVEFHRHFDGFNDLNPDDVVCGPGSKELICLILTVFRGTVYILSPSWTTYLPQTLLTGRRCVQVNLTAETGWKVTPQALTAALTPDPHRLLIINNPDNPTGQVYSDCELSALAASLRANRIAVISDEIYARLNFSPGGHRSLASHYPEGTIVTSGISKWAGAGGWRLGYALFPGRLGAVRAAVGCAATHTYTCCSTPVQRAALALLGDPVAAEEHSRLCAGILGELARRCEVELIAAGAQLAPSGGGFYVMPDFEVAREGLRRKLGGSEPTGAAMCSIILRETGVALMPAGPEFRRPDSELTVRLCFVEFDGAAALAEAARWFGRRLPVDFVDRHCQPTHSAVARLARWLREIQLPDGPACVTA